MTILQVGCLGVPLRDPARYAAYLPAIEVGETFSTFVRPATLRRWREEAGAGFEFVVRCHRHVTHPEGSGPLSTTTGHFRDTPEVARAWQATARAADILRSRMVVFETPPSFFPTRENLLRLEAFLGRDGPVQGAGLVPVFEPRGPWDLEPLLDTARQVGLVLCVDPLRDTVPRGAAAFGHLHGYLAGRRGYGPDHLLSALEALLAGGPERAYLFVGGPHAERDARRAVGVVLEGVFSHEERPGLRQPLRVGDAPWTPGT